MRLVVIASSALLAACTAEPAANDQAAAPTPSRTGNISGGDEAAGLAAFRAEWLEACIGGARDVVPPGTPVERHCGCAIDRMMAGKTLGQLEAEQASGAYRAPFQAELRRCIREIPS